ncbi:MAG: metal ABC transporter permease [Endomicrobium sp.]|jgi:manganese/iron transport system permease protein|nr:metal ABC transporter permease [Endomicrobium sp.]
MLSYFFIKAAAASLFAGFACGIIGVWIYLLNMPFVGIAMAHTAFAGAVIGLLIGINPVFAAFVLCAASSFFIGPVAEKGNFSPNISTGILFSFMLGIAFLFMGKLGSDAPQALSFMWGSILTVSPEDVALLAAVCAAILVFLFFFKRGIVAVIYNRSVAFACGIPEKFIFYCLIILCAVTVSFNIKTVGGLLIYSLITIPAAAAAQFTKKLSLLYVLSSSFAVLSCLSGLAGSYLLDLPAGASIIVAASLIFGAVFAVKNLYGKHI